MVRAQREVEEAAERSGFRMNASQYVRELSVGEQQRVEILKTLVRGARILILDEPTAVLSPPEVQELWRVLRSLRDDGGTIILITHKLDEVAEISDRITVVRAGRTVASFATSGDEPRGDRARDGRARCRAPGRCARRAQRRSHQLERRAAARARGAPPRRRWRAACARGG